MSTEVTVVVQEGPPVVEVTIEAVVVGPKGADGSGGGGGATNLSVGNITATTLEVRSDTGADATIPAATASTAGLATAAQITTLNGAAADATSKANAAQAAAIAAAATDATSKANAAQAAAIAASAQRASNLSDLASASTARTNLGLGTLATQSGTFSGTSSGTNTGDQNTFGTIAVSGQSDVVADSTSDTLTLIAGTNVTITTSAGGDSITIAASGGGGGGATNLSVVNVGASTLDVASDTGTDATIPAATASTAGLATAAQITKLDAITGTNTGDQTITLTGDVGGSGTGSFAATIANNAVTYAKIQNVSATDKVLGRSSPGAGQVEEIPMTAAGRALAGAADVAAQMVLLGAGVTMVRNFYGTVGTATWNKPTGHIASLVRGVGAAGGSGSGRKGAASSFRGGGHAGAPGGFNEHLFLAADLPSSVTVTVPAGGAGGASVTAPSTNGNNGANGADATFGTYLVCPGGMGGLGGTAATTYAPMTTPSLRAPFPFNQAVSDTSAHSQTISRGCFASGFTGGWIPTSNTLPLFTIDRFSSTADGGYDGQKGLDPSGALTGGVTATTAGGSGGNGVDTTFDGVFSGSGGGGGRGSTSGNAGSGGNGGKYGASGGGGGAAVNAVGNSGAGGNGGQGCIEVIDFIQS